MIVVGLFLAPVFLLPWPAKPRPWHGVPAAPLRPHQPQHSHKPPSPALKYNHSHVIGNSIKTTAPESASQITGLNWGGGGVLLWQDPEKNTGWELRSRHKANWWVYTDTLTRRRDFFVRTECSGLSVCVCPSFERRKVGGRQLFVLSIGHFFTALFLTAAPESQQRNLSTDGV